MLMKSYWMLGLFALVFILIACEGPDRSNNVVNYTETEGLEVQLPENTPKVSPPLPLSFRGKLANLGIGETSNINSMSLMTWRADNLPGNPVKIVYHLDNIELFFELNDATEQEIHALLEQITINGEKKKLEQSGRNPQFRLLLTASSVTTFEIRLGDLPIITAEKMTPLSYKQVTLSGNIDPKLLLIHAQDYGGHLMVPMDEKSVTLEFSEKMERTLPTADGIVIYSEWVDDKHLRIHLENEGAKVNYGARQIFLRVDQLRAVSGNRLYREGSLNILRIPPLEWKDGSSGEKVGWGQRDSYYEQLILSPDRNSFVGVVRLGGSMSGDGDGWSYAFVLEQKGQDPIIIENVFYSTIEPYNSPIRWINSNTLLYASYYGVYEYNTGTMNKRTIHSSNADESDSINYTAWDSFKDRLYVLSYKDRGKTQMTNLLTFDDKEEPAIKQNYSESVQDGKYSMLELSVIPTAEGVYWTRTEAGVPVTDYITDNNTTHSVKGIVRLATSDGVYIQRYLPDSIIKLEGWWHWEPGKKEKRIADPPQPGDVFVSGANLISQLDGNYFQYNSDKNEWVKWRAIGGETDAEPVWGPDGLYRYILPHAGEET